MNKPIIKQSCPLCASQAEFKLFDFEARKHFRCPKCVRFIITIGAEEIIGGGKYPDKLKEYSESAKNQPVEYILELKENTLGKQPLLIVEPILRSTLQCEK
jgi:hypothetical protein